MSSQRPVPGDVPNAVRTLLLATKEMQNVLHQWGRGEATETVVSDQYVQLCSQFNTTVHAFAFHKIDVSEIHSVPRELRAVLEQCLAEDPSPVTLALFMPDVRRAIWKMLKGLQLRQETWRAIANMSSSRAPSFEF
ncbi:hypothetical protein C8J56DRAFT_930460 [Mycena floridula]|nr:hypothetical protein C8J56DRAFT_930460 [Mycena floridula]